MCPWSFYITCIIFRYYTNILEVLLTYSIYFKEKSLDFFSEKLWWLQAYGQIILCQWYKSHVFFSIDIFLGNFAYILKIHIVKCIRYVIESTACMQNNGGCSTFCLPTPTGRACACEEGVDLMADGKTCEVSGGKKTISSCCFQLHYIVFLYMYSLFYFNK